MKKTIFIFCLLIFYTPCSIAIAADKVVVIPLGSGGNQLFNQMCPGLAVMAGINENGKILCRYQDKLVNVDSKTVFLSSLEYNGNLGGLTGADAKCNLLANVSGLRGNYKAWLSDDTDSPASRFTKSNTSYVLVTGKTVAWNWADLTSGTLRHSINTDEHATEYDYNYWAHSNTARDGTILGGAHCNNWTGVTGGGSNGNYLSLIEAWTEGPSMSCAQSSHRLYCFEQ